MKEFEQNAFGQAQDGHVPANGASEPAAFTPTQSFESTASLEVDPTMPDNAADAVDASGTKLGSDNDNADDAGIGHPRVRRICRAAHVDLREARVSRWTDTVDLLTQRAPQYLQPFLAYAEG